MKAEEIGPLSLYHPLPPAPHFLSTKPFGPPSPRSDITDTRKLTMRRSFPIDICEDDVGREWSGGLWLLSWM